MAYFNVNCITISAHFKNEKMLALLLDSVNELKLNEWQMSQFMMAFVMIGDVSYLKERMLKIAGELCVGLSCFTILNIDAKYRCKHHNTGSFENIAT